MLKLISDGGILRPALLHFLANADQLVSQHFQPAQHGMEERTLSGEDFGQKKTHRLGESEHHQEINDDL